MTVNTLDIKSPIFQETLFGRPSFKQAPMNNQVNMQVPIIES